MTDSRYDDLTQAEMREALSRTFELRTESMNIDRRGWTTEDWVADARRLMEHLDGSVVCLLNGHVMALISALDRATDPSQKAGS